MNKRDRRARAIKGGKARAKSMTKAERSDVASLAANERWAKAKNLPRATHGSPERPLKVGDVEIPCYVLNNGKRVITRNGLLAAMGLSAGGVGGDRVASFALSDTLKPFMPEGIDKRIEPIEFVAGRSGRGGSRAHGYEATVLADFCDAVLAARRAGGLQKQQEHIAARAEILMAGFARVGIIALVDEATGYQADRDRHDLEKFLRAWLSEKAASWVRMFPEDFFKEACRLKGWTWKASTHGPRCMGSLVNEIVYERLHPDILARLEAYNPSDKKGRRPERHHQFFRRPAQPGHDSPQQHLRTMVEIATRVMTSSHDYEHFISRYDPVFPRPEGVQNRIPFAEPEAPKPKPPEVRQAAQEAASHAPEPAPVPSIPLTS